MSEQLLEIEWAKGQDGRSIKTVTAPPTMQTARFGEYAIQLVDGKPMFIWGPKTGSGWGDPVRIPGEKFVFKDSALTNDDGIDGDSALTVIDDVLRLYGPKTDGAWGAAVATLPLLLLSGGTLTGFLTLHADASSDMHPVTKRQFDALAANLGATVSVRVATTANITIASALNVGDTIDGVVLADGDVVLVKNQSSAAQNGIYVAGASPARDERFDTYNEHPGLFFYVEEGSTNGTSLWRCASSLGGTIGSTAINFSPIAVGVATVFGRSGAVVAASGDYSAAQVSFSPGGTISSTNVQSAIAELGTEKAAASHTHSTSDVTDLSEVIADTVGAMFSGNTETFIAATYQDADNTIDLVVPVLDEDNMSSNSNAHLPTQQSVKAYVDAGLAGKAATSHTHSASDVTDFSEVVADAVGSMVAGNTEAFITVTYQDSDNTLDFTVPVLDEDNMASNSAVHLPTQQSVKAYADTKLAASAVSTFGGTLIDDADASTARATLGVVIGTHVQAYSANLAAFAGLSLIADRLPYANGTGTLSLTPFSTIGRTVVGAADAAAVRTAIGVVGSGGGTFTGNIGVGSGVGSSFASIELGGGRSADGVAYIDLVGDTFYTDYGLRIIRNGGQNGTVQIIHRGTGGMNLTTQESAPIVFNVGNAQHTVLELDGTIKMGASGAVVMTASRHPQLRSYTISGLPSAATAAQLIYVSDGVGGRRLAVSDGTNWRMLLDDTAGPTLLSTPALSVELAAAADIVAAFVYDTRLDSDGGDWRRRCRHTSWYQETLNTATRGRRRDFPEVALIVLRSGATNTIAIYDAHDIDPATGKPRIWKIIPRGLAFRGWTPTKAAKALNGRVAVAADSGSTGELYIYDFAADVAELYDANGRFRPRERGLSADVLNAGATGVVGTATSAIAGNRCTDVDMRVMPGAPLDDAGVPIPTIAVATTAGISIVHPSGLVADITFASGYTKVRWMDDGRLLGQVAADIRTVDILGIVYADATRANALAGVYHGAGGLSGSLYRGNASGVAAIDGPNVGTGLAATFYSENKELPAEGMQASISTLYATGWLPGDTRRAWLCEGATGNLVAANLVLNGDFASGTTNWTANNSSLLSVVSGKLRITENGAHNPAASQSFATVVGQTYVVKFDVDVTTLTWGVQIYDSNGAVKTVTGPADGSNLEFTFTARLASTGVQVYGVNGLGTGNYIEFDNISVSLSVPDRSYKGESVAAFGTLSRAAVATGADLAAFSSFSNSNYLRQEYSADLDFGTGDFSVFSWINATSVATARVFFERSYHSGGYSGSAIRLQVDSSDRFSASISDDSFSGPDTDTVTTTRTIGDDLWHLLALVRRGSVIELWIDGVLAATGAVTNAAGSLSNASAVCWIGRNGGASLNAGATKIALVRVAVGAPTPKQIRKMFADEAPLFRANAKAFLGGTSSAVAALSADPVTGQVAAATGDGVSIFSGLSRVGYLDTAAVPALASDNMRAVALRGPNLLLVGASNVVAYREEAWAIDEAARAGRDPKVERITFRGVTTDASPTDLAPRLLIGERELMRGIISVVGRMYGAIASERFSTVLEFIAYRNSGGDVQLSIPADDQYGVRWDTTGAAPIVTTVETTSGMDAVVVRDTSAQTIGVQVTGVAATRIVWTAEIQRLVRVTEDWEYAA